MRSPMLISALLLVTCCASVHAETGRTYPEIMAAAAEAFRAEDWPTLLVHLEDAQALHPYSLFVAKNRILAYHRVGRTDTALALADTIAARGLTIEMTGHEALVELGADPRFAPIGARMAAHARPMGRAEVVFELAEDDLLPEAFASTEHGAYVGSVRTGRILHLGPHGTVRIVATAPGAVFDLEARDATLWAVVNDQFPFAGAQSDTGAASVIGFDPRSGVITHEFAVAGGGALLGDLEVGSDGTIYASDSRTPRLFRRRAGGETLEVFASDPRFANLQGIALDEAAGRLFTADYLTGLFVVDTHTAEVRALGNPSGAHLGGIDGLVWYEGALIGIQNGTVPQRIVHIVLDRVDRAAHTVVRVEILQQALPAWHEPTHGAVVGDAFHYIATSNWPAYDEQGGRREGVALQPLRILSVGLPTR